MAQTFQPPRHPMLTIGEVAEYMRVTEKTVFRWLQKGFLPCVRVGGTTRIRRQDLLEVLRYSRTKKAHGGTIKGKPLAE